MAKVSQIQANVPRPYIAILAELEDFAKKTQENKDKIKMNQTNQKSFATMKQKIKKHNKNYEKEIEAFRQSPNEEPEEEEEEEDGVEFTTDEGLVRVLL